MTQPRRDQHQGGLAVREGTHDPRTTSRLADDPCQWVVGPDLPLVRARERVVGQCLGGVVADLRRCLAQLHRGRLRRHRPSPSAPRPGRPPVRGLPLRQAAARDVRVQHERCRPALCIGGTRLPAIRAGLEEPADGSLGAASRLYRPQLTMRTETLRRRRAVLKVAQAEHQIQVIR